MANMSNFPNPGGPSSSGSRFDSGSMGKNIQEGATGLKEKAEDAMCTIKEKASDLASTATEKARAAVDVVSEKAGDIASTIGDQAKQAASKVGDTWETGKHYVEERGIEGMASDVGDLIRRYPLPALMLGVCAGFFLARSMRD